MQMENKKRMPQQAPQAKADKAPAEQDTALVWGKNPVTELLKSEAGVDTLLLADSMEPRMAGYYTALGKAAGAVIKRVPAGKLQKVCGTHDHQGVAHPVCWRGGTFADRKRPRRTAVPRAV